MIRRWRLLLCLLALGAYLLAPALIAPVTAAPAHHSSYLVDALFRAAQIGDKARVSELIALGARVEVKDIYQWTPLHWASCKGHTEAARLLLEHGAHVNAKDLNGWTSLHQAAHLGHTEAARLLLEHGAHVNAKDSYQETPLHAATNRCQTVAARLLLEYGANVDAKDNTSCTPLHCAASQGDTETARVLLQCGASVDASNSHDQTPLDEALASCHLETASFLRFAEMLFSSLNVKRGSQAASHSILAIALRAAETAAAMLPGEQITETEALKSKREQQFQRFLAKDIAHAASAKGGIDRYARYLNAQPGRISDLKDLRDEIAGSLVLPLWYLDHPGAAKTDGAVTVAARRNIASRFVARRLLRQHTALDLHRLNRAWHHNNQLPDALLPLKREGEWHPLFEGEHALNNDGLSIVALSDSRSLVAEGEALSHCVGSGDYARKGLNGESHLLSIRKNVEPVATIELEQTEKQSAALRTPDGTSWRVAQFSAYRNTNPPAEVKQAWASFVDQLRQGQGPKLSREHGETQESKSRRALAQTFPASHHVGFPLDQAHEYLPKILAHYQSRVYFESGRKRRIEGQAEKARERTPLIPPRTARMIERRISRMDMQ